jgi:hypothetical protein
MTLSCWSKKGFYKIWSWCILIVMMHVCVWLSKCQLRVQKEKKLHWKKKGAEGDFMVASLREMEIGEHGNFLNNSGEWEKHLVWVLKYQLRFSIWSNPSCSLLLPVSSCRLSCVPSRATLVDSQLVIWMGFPSLLICVQWWLHSSKHFFEHLHANHSSNYCSPILFKSSVR